VNCPPASRPGAGLHSTPTVPTPRAALTRRQFLTTTGVVALAATCPALAAKDEPVETLVGTQLYGWGQYYERDGKKLYDHLDDALSAIRDCGYHYAEGSMDAGTPENNAKFAGRLRAKGLKPVSLYTGGQLHQDGKADQTVEALLAAAKVCRQAGFSVINCNPDPIGRDKTDEELKTQAAALKRLGAGLKEIGLRLGIHHHTPEMRNGAREFHSNFKLTPPAVVGFCYDVHWVYRGGVQPSDCLKQYSDRVVSWHLRQSRDQIWWEDLAPGDIDYLAVAKFARTNRLAPYYTVELAIENGTKITRSVVENHRRSRDYVRQVFGA
jgi:inosose dehydratase